MAKGITIYQGPSAHDGEPIVAVATGLKGSESRNGKTGPIVQIWFLRSDLPPVEAALSGGDHSVCGGCRLRGKSPNRACYVRLEWAPTSIYKAVLGGQYPEEDLAEFKDQVVRLGAYGDPTAVPVSVLRKVASHAKHVIGYTHEWRDHSEVQPYCMASVETEEEQKEAKSLGWRTFRIWHPMAPARLPNEILCPATKRRVTCQQCLLCVPGRATKDIVMPLHGSPDMKAAFYERIYGPHPKQMELL